MQQVGVQIEVQWGNGCPTDKLIVCFSSCASLSLYCDPDSWRSCENDDLKSDKRQRNRAVSGIHLFAVIKAVT